jgi:hypothetical protein
VPRYEEHPSKASSWRDGQFVVLPDAEAADTTVWFGANAEADGEPLWEGLLAKRTGSDRARVCAVPFWLYDLNLGDEVSVIDSAEGALVANGIVNDAGAFAFRVIFDGADADDDRWRQLMVELEPYGCSFDVRSPGFVALSSPAEHAQTVADLLSAREERGELQYETGRSAVPGAAQRS